MAAVLKNFVQILTTNIKGGLTVVAKAIRLKFIQWLTMPLIPLRLTKPNWWFDQSIKYLFFTCSVAVDNYLKVIKLQDVDELFALISLPCACVFFLQSVMLHSATAFASQGYIRPSQLLSPHTPQSFIFAATFVPPPFWCCT